MPESPKWLLTVNQKMKAEKIVNKAAKENGRELPEDWNLSLLSENKKKKTRLGKRSYEKYHATLSGNRRTVLT